jgi:hypothetical protein
MATGASPLGRTDKAQSIVHEKHENYEKKRTKKYEKGEFSFDLFVPFVIFVDRIVFKFFKGVHHASHRQWLRTE